MKYICSLEKLSYLCYKSPDTCEKSTNTLYPGAAVVPYSKRYYRKRLTEGDVKYLFEEAAWLHYWKRGEGKDGFGCYYETAENTYDTRVGIVCAFARASL
ncbi:hypothetical protein OESDEN_23579 [Oesophagostomum dentatum]|uniref:SCP domain-containing protein n=1 Tax=Oesophagostomum dentatum TaxID=61180 RepID=A0A0B1RYT1_OESDE|nr:hypothetical protein OESDEN_23579 [Oesophagostomum dentatum]